MRRFPEASLNPAVSRRHCAALAWSLSTSAQASLDDELEHHRSRHRPRMAWQDAPHWADSARRTAQRLVFQPGDDGSPFDTECLAREDRGDHWAERLRFTAAHGQRTGALQLRPKRPGPHPAVLLLHDHGARFDIGKEKLIRPIGDAPREAAGLAWSRRYFDGHWLGERLVQAGHVVMAADALGWGERARPGFGRDDQQALAAHLQQLGLSWAGLIASDDLRALRCLRAQADVDPRRVATMGFSMGAFRAWQLAALAPDGVQACVAAHWMCTREGLLRPGGHTLQGQSAYAMLHPGLAAELDHPDIAALIAPRPMLLLASPADPLFPWDAVQHSIDQLSRAWPTQGEAAFRLRVTPDGHRLGQEAQDEVLRWLEARFRTPA